MGECRRLQSSEESNGTLGSGVRCLDCVLGSELGSTLRAVYIRLLTVDPPLQAPNDQILYNSIRYCG